MDAKSKICLSIGNIGFEEVLQQLQKVDLAEIRMDLLSFTDEQYKAIFQSHRNIIATFRSPEGNYLKLSMMMALAIEGGCAYVDIDIFTPDSFRNTLIHSAKSRGVKVILSYHNFSETPSSEKLNSLVDELFLLGANIAKVACMANSPAECARVLGLYDKYQNLVAFCMGEMGRETRLASPMLGAPFTYASIKGKETAPGQLAFEEVDQFLKSKL
jgi:3-dehydroquinate dehydratase-1